MMRSGAPGPGNRNCPPASKRQDSLRGVRPLMKVWNMTSVLLAAAILLLAGCQETGSKQVRVRPPAAAPTQAPTPAPAQPPSTARQPLPLPGHGVSTASVSRDLRPAIDILVEKVQASVDAGQQEEQAGNPAKAAADFDHALD